MVVEVVDFHQRAVWSGLNEKPWSSDVITVYKIDEVVGCHQMTVWSRLNETLIVRYSNCRKLLR